LLFLRFEGGIRIEKLMVSCLHGVYGGYKRLDEDLILAWGRLGEIFDIVVRPTYFLDLDSFHLVWLLLWVEKILNILNQGKP
jgi:hypothetical protein